MQKISSDKAERRARHAWYLYDFGNSAYAAVILLAVFSPYFKDVVVGNGVEGTRLWGLAVGIASVLVALMSPVFGTIADFTKSKKKFLFVFTAISVLSTALLFFVRAGDVFTGMLFFILAEIGYRGAQVFYDALLTDVSTPESVGSVSGKGWGLGMLGGIAALLVVLAPLQLIGNSIVPYTFLITAFIYMISGLPTFLFVKEKNTPEQLQGKNVIAVAFHKLAQTFISVRKHKEFVKYAISFLIYNDGIMMLMDFAAIIGGTLFGMKQIQLIIFVILIHISGAIGALLFGKVADKRGSKKAILLSLLILTASVAGLLFIDRTLWFYVIGFVAGFSLSGAQAVSRSMVSQLAPREQAAEFYGFLSVAGRTSTFVGPLVFSTISYRMHNRYVRLGLEELQAEKLGLLWAIGAIIAFLIVGALLLILVRQPGKNSQPRKPR